MLRVEKITYEVKGRKLLKDVSFQLRKGEVLALLGANGAGKSSLMRLLCGDTVPTEGQVSLMGKPLQQYSPIELAKKRAMLAQHNNMSMAFKVREIVQMGRYPHYRSVPSAHDHEIVDEVMDVCGISNFADRSYLSLSGGEQQRVQLARVLVQIWDNPDSLLLLDEPVSALDLQFQQQVLALTKALSRKGLMVVVVLHDINLAALYSDRILMLKNGRKWCEGTPIEVMEKQNIYTVFSVQADVSIDTKTLQPIVKLEELFLDADQFNTKLPHTAHADKLIDGCIKDYKSDPFYRMDEVAVEMGLSELQLLKMAYPQQISVLIPDFGTLLTEFVKLGAVYSIVYNKVGYMELKGMYSLPIRDQNQRTWIVQYGAYRMILDITKWKVGVAVCNEWGQSFQFFDEKGALLHKVALIEGSSNRAEFEALRTRYKSLNQDMLQTNTDSSSSVSVPSLPVYGNRSIALSVWKGIVAQSFAQKTTASCSMIHAEGVYAYEGRIMILVDQGERYQIIYPDCTITLDRLQGVKIVLEKNETDTDAATFSLYAVNDTVALQFRVEKKLLAHPVCADYVLEAQAEQIKNSI
ncbi:heme ABC transporter ATP-binding protein [Sphingobacterium pedocola]|uniref:Heme ABC transporter ATP-binding protein n=1 Tax=Sphingobacterium pedocola TaxID=2082722 RepID=A0ABR9T7F9_9SPHI|nr:heme ABC transporter ATP-binding protein [Sphingobacterium pedocola]MBE8721291.1 heme ABC transporter ATP-binding protein [Sphingobacterium pedocola]